MARKFLYAIAILIGLVIAALFILRIWSQELAQAAFVPSSAFEEQAPLAAGAYGDADLWLARPGEPGEELARWLPSIAPEDAEPLEALLEPAEPAPPHAVFFIHPTSYMDRSRWNGPLDDAESRTRASLFVQAMASPFGAAETIWAPRYRQATFGSFLTDSPEALAAIALAYADVEQAFAAFLAAVPADRPIVLAGHSQGGLHALTLLHQRIAGTPLAERIVAVYAVGWPVSVAHDLPALGLPACSAPDQAGCVASWLSYAEPAEMNQALGLFRQGTGLDGQVRGDGPLLCFNPLTGAADTAAAASANLGTLVPEIDLSGGRIVRQAVPARCDERGLLLIGDPPELGPFVLPGNDYHVYDIPLFWANLRADVARRVGAWQAAR